MTDSLWRKRQEPERSMKVEGPLHVVCQCDQCKAQPEPYDQTALELCNVCGWKTLIPDDACLNCERAQPKEQEPVAWISPKELLVMRGNAYAGAKDWRVNLGLEPEEGDVGLYTTPPQRNPLTDEQKSNLVTNWFAEDWAIKAALGMLEDYEAAHGIKE